MTSWAGSALMESWNLHVTASSGGYQWRSFEFNEPGPMRGERGCLVASLQALWCSCHLLLMGDSCSGTALTQQSMLSPCGCCVLAGGSDGLPSFRLGAWSQAQLPLPPDRLTRSGMP